MQRITDSVLLAKLVNVNNLYRQKFAVNRDMVELYHAYGSVAVVGTIENSSGTSELSGLGTKREAAKFLDGMRHALYMIPSGTAAGI